MLIFNNDCFSEIDGIDDHMPNTSVVKINGATTEGSQCSSSCSTVVVVNNTPVSRASRRRRISATSSLELGSYSHTAQNSTVSTETASFPGAIYDRCRRTVKYAGKNFILLNHY